MTVVSPNPVGKHITFADGHPSASGKTKVWDVRANADQRILGRVAWFGRWRRYAFFPASETVFESECLTDIANWCTMTTYQHLKSRRQERVKTAKGDPS